MSRVIDNLGGLWALLRLAARTGFKMRGPYWRWRYETALGTDPKRRPKTFAQLRAILAYGRWLHRIRKAHWQ